MQKEKTYRKWKRKMRKEMFEHVDGIASNEKEFIVINQ
jgi:hypothetical protein